jgi:hypothetical protein
MSAQPQLPRRSKLIWGLVLVVVSVVECSLIYFQPQQLKAPAWVAYVAASSLGIAGLLLLLAGATGVARTQNWLAVALVLSMVLPGIWIAFGKGERECTVSLPFLQFASDALCRGAFGVGALLGMCILVLYIRRAMIRQGRG